MAAERFLVFVVLIPGFAFAAPPTLTSIAPRGVERGKTSDVILQGTNLTPQTRLQLPFPAKQELVPDPKHNPARVKLRITVDAEAPIDVYPIRVATEEGLSALTFFGVDAFPNVEETEDNSTPEKANAVPIPCVINGQCPGGDVDFFRFSAKKGQRLVIETETGRIGSSIVPQLRLTDDRRRFIAADDSQSVRGDDRIVFLVPGDGDYLLETSDSRYRGGTPAYYRIKIGDCDFLEEMFPAGGKRGESVELTLRGGSLARELRIRPALVDRGESQRIAIPGWKAGLLLPEVIVGEYPEKIANPSIDRDPKRLDFVAPVTINGRLEHPGAGDRFQLAVSPGQKYRFTVEAQSFGSHLDGVLRIADRTGKPIALVDDVSVPARLPGQLPYQNPDPSVEVTVPADVSLLAVELRDQRKRGGVNFAYRLTVEPLVADFQLFSAVAEVNVPRGGYAMIPVTVQRRGYLGPIRLSVPDLPSNYTVQGGLIPANALDGILTIAATPTVPSTPIDIRIVGTGDQLRRIAVHPLVVSKDPASPRLIRTLTRIAVAPTNVDPLIVQGPATIEVVQGYSTPIPIAVARTGSTDRQPIEITAASAVAGQPLPGGFTIVPGGIAADKTAGTFLLTAPFAVAEGEHSFVAQAKAKVANVDRIVIAPAFVVHVVRPFTVTAPESITLIPGQTATLTFKVTRKEPFKEAITLRLDGLPVGVTLTAPLSVIAPNRNELVVQLKVDPKANLPIEPITATATATVNGLPYIHPAIAIEGVLKK